MQLISKCGIKLVSKERPEHRVKSYDTSAEHITRSVETSLKNLRTDYLDLLLIHRPDPLLAAQEVAEAFSALLQQGKVRAFGVSNFTTAQLDLLASTFAPGLVANQIEFGPLHLAALTDGTLDQCQRQKLLPMAWSPLGGGRLMAGSGAEEQRILAALQAVGLELGGASADQVAISWILRHPAGIAPILGSNNLGRIRAMAEAASLQLPSEQWHEIWSAAMGTPVP